MNPNGLARRLDRIEATRRQQADAVAFLPTAAQVAADLVLIDAWADRLELGALVPSADLDLAERFLTDHAIDLPRLD